MRFRKTKYFTFLFTRQIIITFSITKYISKLKKNNSEKLNTSQSSLIVSVLENNNLNGKLYNNDGARMWKNPISYLIKLELWKQ